jgi:glutamyl-tRNA synthetase
MGTTHVVRGSEWISSYPLHAQLFEMFGWERPVYAHIAPIEKLDGSSRRKLSKRSDPEASVAFYAEQGYPVESIIDYLMTLADSRFEAWRLENPAAPAGDWKVDPARMSRSGALFDMTKLDSVSRDRIGRQTGAEIYDLLVAWSENHDPAFADLLKADRGYAVAILDIERNRERARKDVAKWSDVKTGVEYFFDSVFETKASEVTGLMASQMPQAPAAMLRQIAAGYDATLPHEEWLAWMREMGIRHGYAPSAKTYKKSPEGFRGHFGDLAETMRVVLTGRKTAPDLHEVMLVLGVDRVKARVDRALSLSASLADSPEDPFDAGCEAKGPTA